ncbi:hypothetical protein LOC68_01910 [Blastopirellula sp. JC732]|uniref:Phenylacetate--CoA ligase family protein n=1 Tax=Blastopirellula sediminis TaxID=2894196 RepID=A0A9X1MIF1_9BACT|nr:hypothetical protein [Blastopirellula sediminis]MCC9608056.1 hypothetical protein [Blastopirellula sediminis]MCC9627151.1 hypothetical protein [Blastopirellula sediminis]
MLLINSLPRFRRARIALADFAKRESWSRSEIEAYQLERINSLWTAAISDSPYYRRLQLERNLPTRFEDLEEFRENVPVLSKDKVRSEPKDILSNKPEHGEWHYTSGSSGARTGIYRSTSVHRKLIQGRYRFNQIWDVDFLDRWAYLWGNAEGLAPGWKGMQARITTPFKDWLRNRLRIAPYDLRPETLRGHLAKIAAYKPVAIYTHSKTAHLLALEAEKIGFEAPYLKLVVMTAEPVRDEYIQDVERAFNTNAVSEYGSIECGFIAGQIRDRTLRVREDNVMVETLPRMDGRYDIAVTLLEESSFPLIRYKIGDVTDAPLTTPSEGFAILHNISGRDFDLIVTGSGALLHAQIFEDILDKFNGIRLWRMQQNSQGNVRVQLVCIDHFEPEAISQIQNRFLSLMEGYEVSVEIVSHIEATSSGKHRTVISELGAQIVRSPAVAGSAAQ